MTRRFLTQVSLKILSVMAVFFTLGAAMPETVSLVERGNVYHIEGAFKVAAARAQVWQVLTDYGTMKGVVSTMKASDVLQRRRTMVLVQQKILGHFLFFNREIFLTLLVDEWPQDYMTFYEVSQKDFKFYRGSWKLEDTKEGVLVRYELDVSRADMAPPFLEKSLFQDNALILLKELKAEIVKRVAAQLS